MHSGYPDRVVSNRRVGSVERGYLGQMKTKLPFSVLAIGALAVLLVAAAAGCGGGDSGSATGTVTEEEGEAGSSTEASGNAPAPSGDAVRSAKVEITSNGYDPDPVTIEEGGKVIWINMDSEPHTATAEDGSFDTGPLEEGKLKSETFKQPGTYRYSSTIGPQMQGTVEVVPAS
jgi:plastocyanin